ncbi:MAG TPA: ATP-binding protein [Desulfotignum sp.]|nr:ATP-binding protein [Desulfotignum sp.]
MKNTDDLPKKIAALEKQNRKLQQFYDAYQQVRTNEKERVKELNCLYQVAQCVVLERNTIAALKQIVHIIPTGWQFSRNCCARIRFKENIYLSSEFFASEICQTEDIYIDNEAVGDIEVYYHPTALAGTADPFLTEERNLLKGIANIISFYMKKQKDDEARKIIQNQLLHNDRLATIGRLAAGVAHELNEPLGNILGLAQLSLKVPDLPEQAENDLSRIQECVIYSREIIKKLLAFSRNTPVRKEKICLNQEIENSLTFLAARCARQGITIEKRFSEDVFVMADANQIQQVVTNLTVNAIQAMENGGKITLTVKKAADKAVFSIEDTGVGIPGGHISSAFMPFFTTKDVDQGTGLGLSVVYGIVKNHDGDIKVSSEPGKGSIFEISLPLENG